MKEKDTARTICVVIAVVPLVLLMLVIAVPSMYEKYSDQTNYAALQRIQNLSISANHEMVTAMPANETEKDMVKSEADLAVRTAEQSTSDEQVLFYTVQAGSYETFEGAMRGFEQVTQKFDGELLDYLRIERINEYYTVRIGKFENKEEAESLYSTIKSRLSSVILMDAHIKEDRIHKLLTS